MENEPNIIHIPSLQAYKRTSLKVVSFFLAQMENPIAERTQNTTNLAETMQPE
jgi:hypothetical protein